MARSSDQLPKTRPGSAFQDVRYVRAENLGGIFRNGNRLCATGTGNRNQAGGRNKNSLVPETAWERPLVLAAELGDRISGPRAKGTHIYIYGNPPMNYRPSFCIVNTVSKQLFRQVRILYLSKTTENKPRFQENVSVNSFTFDVRSASSIS